MAPAGTSLVWGSARVERAVDAYESVVFNAYWDLEEMLPPALLVALVFYLLRRYSRTRSGRRSGISKQLSSDLEKGE